jgi:hypothetical protein
MQAPTRSIALRALWAGILVSFLAGPVFLWLTVAASEPPPADSEFPLRISDIGALLYLSPAISIVGLAVSVPAAFVNAIVLMALAQRRTDGLVPAIISASIWGTVIPVALIRLFGPKRLFVDGEHALTATACLAVTGGALGIVYWLIAVRPIRSSRLRLRIRG